MTNFSFEFAGKRHFSVPAPGWPNIEAGSRLTVALRKPGNWQTVVGWINHTNGDVILPDTEFEEAKLWVFPVCMLLGCIFALVVDDIGWCLGSACFALFCGTLAGVGYCSLRRKKAFILEITRVASSIHHLPLR